MIYNKNHKILFYNIIKCINFDIMINKNRGLFSIVFNRFNQLFKC